MQASDRALSFAIRAHAEQVRKSEKDKPMIIHPMIVGDLLKVYGYDDNVIAAGYLHDVVEDTPFTIEEISRLFGGDISSMVMTASEPDKSLSWEERKKHTIKIIKDLPERNKAIICADKIANLEDLELLFKKLGHEDFSAFKRGKEDQLWYYQSIYEALKEGFDSPMLERLENDILNVFYDNSNLFIKEEVIANNDEYNRIQKLDGYKEELLKLKNVLGEQKPYIIEFSGTKNSGKSSIIHVISDFFKKGGFKVKVMEDPITDNELLPDYKSLSPVEKNLLIASGIETNLMHEIAGDQDILLVERGLFDRLVMMQLFLNKNLISEDGFLAYLDYYLPEIEYLVNHVVICYTEPLTSLQRETYRNLSIPDLDDNSIADYNEALDGCKSLINGFGTSVDTTALSEREATLRVAEALLPIMRKDYIKQLKKYLDSEKGNIYK